MADRVDPRMRAALEYALVDLATHMEWPEPPDVRAAVLTRVGDRPVRPVGRLRPATVRRPWLAIAAIVLIAIVATLAVPSWRRAVADRLGIHGVHVHSLAPGETLPPVASTLPPVGGGLELGVRMTLADAQRQVGFRILVPTLAGFTEPDEVYLEPEGGGEVSLVYRARPDLPAAPTTGVAMLLTEFPGDATVGFDKIAGSATRAVRETVNGGVGIWLEGGDHYVFATQGKKDEVLSLPGRLAGNTLIWEQPPISLRLETALPLGRVLPIAQSTR